MTQHLSAQPETLKKCLEGGNLLIIDVRTPAEFSSMHLAEAINIPLDRLQHEINQGRCKKSLISQKTIFLTCQSGRRAEEAAKLFLEHGIDNIRWISGGTESCARAGLPMIHNKGVIAMERQVQITAGSLVLLGLVLGVFFNPWFLLLSAFIGGGLVFAGLSNTCGLAKLLAKMPWNQSDGW